MLLALDRVLDRPTRLMVIVHCLLQCQFDLTLHIRVFILCTLKKMSLLILGISFYLLHNLVILLSGTNLLKTQISGEKYFLYSKDSLYLLYSWSSGPI